MFHKHPNPYFGQTTDGKPLDCILDVLNLMLIERKFIDGIKQKVEQNTFLDFCKMDGPCQAGH